MYSYKFNFSKHMSKIRKIRRIYKPLLVLYSLGLIWPYQLVSVLSYGTHLNVIF